jgi:hypothetical protein
LSPHCDFHSNNGYYSQLQGSARFRCRKKQWIIQQPAKPHKSVADRRRCQIQLVGLTPPHPHASKNKNAFSQDDLG